MTAAAAAAAKSAHQKNPNTDHQTEENDIRQHLLSPLIHRLVYVLEIIVLRQFLHIIEVGIPSRYMQPIVRRAVNRFQQGLLIFSFGLRFAHRFVEHDCGALPVKDHAFHFTILNSFFEFSPLYLPAILAGIEHKHAQKQHHDYGVDPVKIQRRLSSVAILRALVFLFFHGLIKLRQRSQCSRRPIILPVHNGRGFLHEKHAPLRHCSPKPPILHCASLVCPRAFPPLYPLW